MPTFVDFWGVYPRRKGANPRALAELKFNKVVRDGADPKHLISSARKYAEASKEQGLIDTPFVCQASTWLNQKRWLDYEPDPEGYVSKSEAFMKQKGWGWNGQRWVKERPDAEDLL